MSWHVYPVWDSLCLLDLIDYFLSHVGEIFNYNLFKNFLIPFLFLFFFWDPYNSNVGAFDIVPEVSETILSSFHSFYYILLFRSYFHHFIFQLTDSFFCFRYSVIDSCCCCCCLVTSVVSDSVWPQRQQPTRLPRPWDSPGKNTGVGCHCLLQCMKVKSESEVTQSCPTLSDPMDCRLPGSSVHGIFQARVLEWGAIAFSDSF